MLDPREEARMRAVNTEQMRQRVWTQLAVKLQRGELTEAEVRQAKLQFWEDRRADQRAAQGKFDMESAQRTETT